MASGCSPVKFSHVTDNQTTAGQLTVQNVHSDVGHNGVRWRAAVLARVGLVGVLDQQMRGRDVALARLYRNAAAQRVVIDHLRSLQKLIIHLAIC